MSNEIKKYPESEPDDFDEEDFQPCDDCDLPDACADFGCAQKQGLKRIQGDWDLHDDLR